MFGDSIEGIFFRDAECPEYCDVCGERKHPFAGCLNPDCPANNL